MKQFIVLLLRRCMNRPCHFPKWISFGMATLQDPAVIAEELMIMQKKNSNYSILCCQLMPNKVWDKNFLFRLQH